jgi:hypothetical protein
MSILNYFFIGFAFTFIVDLLMNLKPIINHPKMKDKNWGWGERITCILFWPITFAIFTVYFFKSYFKK